MKRVGIVGCGKMGRVYAHWFDQNPHCQVAGFYNRTREKAETLSSSYPGSRVYDRWDELISSDDIDIIGICTPSHQHCDQFIMAMKHDKHTLCEKPMANFYNESVQMYQAAEKSTATAMIGFQMRYHPVVERVNSLLPGLGDLLYLELGLSMYRPEVTWKHTREQGGGVMKELSSHLIDLARMWCGEILSVSGINMIFNSRREVEDLSACFLRFGEGPLGYIYSNYLDRNPSLIKGKMIGANGQVEWQFSSYDPSDGKIFLVQGQERTPVELVMSDVKDLVYPGHMDSFKKEIDIFTDAVINHRKTLNAVQDGVKVMETIGASYLSSKNKQQVILPISHFDAADLDHCFSCYQADNGGDATC